MDRELIEADLNSDPISTPADAGSQVLPPIDDQEMEDYPIGEGRPSALWEAAPPAFIQRQAGPDGALSASNRTGDIFSGATSIRSNQEIIRASGLFDDDWYLRTHRDVATSGMDPLEHYVRFGAYEGRDPTARFDTARYLARYSERIPPGQNPFVDYILQGSPSDLIDQGLLKAFDVGSVLLGIKRLDAMPLFSIDDYATLNSDLSKVRVDHLHHAMTYGFSEGRHVFRKDTVAQVLGRLSREVPVPPAPKKSIRRKFPQIGVFYNTEGNGFIRDLAQDLVTAIRRADQDAILLDETSPIHTRPPLCIFVAPHEYFHLGLGPSWAIEEVVCNAVMFNTEQPQTLWFERSMPFILMSKGLIDICYQVFRIFEEAGLPSMHFNPYIADTDETWLEPEDHQHSMVKVLPENARSPARRDLPTEARPIDISFFGTSSQHRDTFFLRNVSFLADYECYIYYRKFQGPLTNSGRDGLLTRLAGHVATHSKISLNIHRDDYGFFEWHRIVKLGMACGSIVVSEPCLPHPLLKPGTHYFEESGRHIPNLAEWLLKSPDGRMRAEEAREAVSSLIRNKAATKQSGHGLIHFIANTMGNIE